MEKMLIKHRCFGEVDSNNRCKDCDDREVCIIQTNVIESNLVHEKHKIDIEDFKDYPIRSVLASRYSKETSKSLTAEYFLTTGVLRFILKVKDEKTVYGKFEDAVEVYNKI